MNEIATSIPSMAYVLQSNTSSYNEKIVALRSLKYYLEIEENNIDIYNKINIKQLILDSVLKIILNEDKITNVVKKKLVRTELFLILAKILDSNTLFGEILKSPEILHEVDIQIDTNEGFQIDSDEMSSHSDSTVGTKTIESMLINKRNQNKLVPVNNSMILSLSQNSIPLHIPTNSTVLLDKMKSLTRSSSSSNFSKIKSLNKSFNNNINNDNNNIDSLSSISSVTSINVSLLKPSLAQDKIRAFRSKHHLKTWKPRPSVLFSDHIQKDSFVPGTDPLNYIEQDRKLGYQKPRMWFPHNNLALLNTMLPDSRSNHLKKVSGSDQIVKEFLQMRALASYVGDLVTPFVPSKGSYLDNNRATLSTSSTSLYDDNNTTTSRRRLADITDHKRFTQAISEISDIWSPLLGVHLPPHHQPKYLTYRQSKEYSIVDRDDQTYHSSNTNNEHATLPYGEDIKLPFKCLRIEGASYNTGVGSHSAITNSKISSLNKSNKMDKDDKDVISSMNYMSRTTTQYQEDVVKYLQIQRKHVLESIKASEALIAATMRFQYAKLHPNYLLVIEGEKANQRKLIGSTLVIFCRVKRTNLMTLAFGIWKILLVKHASKARLPQYARIVSCHLIARWRDDVHIKKLRIWVIRWKRWVGMLIFKERNEKVILMQKLYRTWRDRRKFVYMHNIKPYLGVLSDIYLATKRNVIFFIPDIIRNQRRFYWIRAIKIQTVFRSWLGSRDYFFKRRMLVLLQSLCRMFPVYRKFRRLRRITIKCQAWSRRTVRTIQYRRLKTSTIIVQKYTRRYLSTLWKWRTWDKSWKLMGISIASAIRIQCRYRIYVVKKRIVALKYKIKLRTYSALVIQRNYFRYRKAFHTFFLMCALSQREQEDLKLERLASTMGKYYASRVLVRFYRIRYIERIIKSLNKVQSWYRGRVAYIIVCRIRRKRWAERKLRHWGRCKVRRRRLLARKIQRWWWLCKKGRMMNHLWIKAALRDKEEMYQQNEREYKAAGRIQAYVKGVWDRRYVRRLRAVLIIQKNAKFYFGLKRWRRWKLDKIRKTVNKVIDKVMRIALKRRTDEICKIHSRMLCKPQALMRGVLIRRIFHRAWTYAYKAGIAVVTIQRYWRKSGAMSKAVEEILVLKRRNSNPFKDIYVPHQIIINAKKLIYNYYCTTDPRIGLKISGLLYRLGFMELLEMFPRKSYAYVFDLTCLTIKELSDIYTSWKTKVDKAHNKSNKNNKNNEKKVIDKVVPIEKLQLILDIAQIPKNIHYHSNSMKEKLRQILPLPEYYSPAAASEMIKKNFAKKYGKNLTTKADRITTDILDWSYGTFNNYKSVGSVLTRAQILKAIAKSTDANQIMESLKTSREDKNGSMDERKWDQTRISKSTEILQFAIDKLDSILPDGSSLKNMIEKANYKLLLYKRKIAFIRMKLTKLSNKFEHENNVDHTISNLNMKKLDILPNVFDMLDLYYIGTLEDLDLEYNISICKVYNMILDKLHMLTCAIQSIKNSWNNKALRRAMKKERTNQFLASITIQYKEERKVNKVKALWNKNRKIESYKKRTTMIMEAVRYRKEIIEYVLSFIPKSGWVSKEDHYGYTYWINTNLRNKDEPVYEMPAYTYYQWIQLLKIQSIARKCLSKLYIKHLEKLEKDRIELEKIELALEEERLAKEKPVTIKCSIYNRVYANEKDLLKKSSLIKVNNNNNSQHLIVESTQTPSLESLLPWKYRFESNPKLSQGCWVLFQSALKGQLPCYEIVIMFRINEKEKVCDVRTVKGKCFRNVKLRRIFQMNLDIGSNVETRYQYKKLFYRSTIIYINNHIDKQPLYTVRYDDDNELEYNLKRDAIRPSSSCLIDFLQGRNESMSIAKLCHRRMVHYMNLRKERMQHTLQHYNYSKHKNNNENNNLELLAIKYNDINSTNKSIDHHHEATITSTALVVTGNEDHPLIEKNDSQQLQVALINNNNNSNKNSTNNNTVQIPFSSSNMIERVFFHLKLKYSRVCIIYNWEAIYENESNSSSSNKPIYYIHTRTNEISYERPEYTAVEVQMIQKIQLAWFIYQAKNKVWKKLISINLLDLIADTIIKGSRIGTIGYELEGVTPMQIVRRAGYWEIADIIENQYKIMKLNIHKLSIDDIINISKDDYEKLGIIQNIHIKYIREFQAWWNKTSNIDKQKRLTLFNYYNDAYDKRTIQECIQESEEVLIKKFSRVIKTGSSRTKQALQVLLSDAYYPHTHQQIETYLKKYGDKPELARELITELINKPTTHTWVEEAQVLKLYQTNTWIIAAICSNRRLKYLHKRISFTMKAIDEIVNPLFLLDKSIKRLICSGPEAKASLLIRKDILLYFHNYIIAIILIQKHVRCYLLYKLWKLKMKTRYKSIALLQRVFRIILAGNVAKRLLAQKTSEWEQLWDSRRNLLYYYNYTTGTSQYNEPNCPFRPLIRDYYSAQLVQAWPEIDNRNGQMARLPSWTGSSISSAIQTTHAICGICKIRKCVRICMGCTDEVYFDANKYHAFPYCFPCYMKNHTEDNEEKLNHQFQVVANNNNNSRATLTMTGLDRFDGENNTMQSSTTSIVTWNAEDVDAQTQLGSEEMLSLSTATSRPMTLQCCMCDMPATRKCLGLLDEDQIEDICLELKRSGPDRWLGILQEANVGGERKLALLLEQIRLESVDDVMKMTKNNSKLQRTSPLIDISTIRSNDSNDDNNKDEVKEEPTFFQSNEILTSSKILSTSHLQDIRMLLERTRAECDECYCQTHYIEVHTGGKRVLHHWKGFCENAIVCSVCNNTPAELQCNDCECQYCGSCYKVFHSMGRKRLHKKKKIVEELGDQSSDYCYVCERRPADQTCVNIGCRVLACDSCYIFKHKPTCDKNKRSTSSPTTKHRSIKNPTATTSDVTDSSKGMESTIESQEHLHNNLNSNTTTNTSATNNTAITTMDLANIEDDQCVVCGELADRRCIQCQDCYCSRVWPGYLGCFHKHHSKGNRLSHKIEVFFSPKYLEKRARERKLLAMKENNK